MLPLRDLKEKLRGFLSAMDGSGREDGQDEKVSARGRGERLLKKGAPTLCDHPLPRTEKGDGPPRHCGQLSRFAQDCPV